MASALPTTMLDSYALSLLWWLASKSKLTPIHACPSSLSIFLFSTFGAILRGIKLILGMVITLNRKWETLGESVLKPILSYNKERSFFQIKATDRIWHFLFHVCF